MNITLVGITLISSITISVIGFRLLLKNKIFSFLKKKNTGGERWASQAKPIFGGVVFYASFLLAILIALLGLDFGSIKSSYMGMLLISISLSFFMGLFDDLQNQGPLNKFIVQLACAGILIYFDVYIQTSDNIVLNYIITVLWITGIMNSINMLDNMDAITGSVTTIILLSIAGMCYFGAETNMLDMLVLTSIIGSLLTYLYYNWHPSRMYMGDNGSQFLGIVLAIFSIKYIWNSTGNVDGFNYREFLLIGLAFLLPLVDTATVFINRISAGKSPFVGDRYHTTHNLVYLGLKEKGVALTFIIISLITNFAVFYIIAFTDIIIHKNYYYALLAFAIIIAVVFFIISRVVRNKN